MGLIDNVFTIVLFEERVAAVRQRVRNNGWAMVAIGIYDSSGFVDSRWNPWKEAGGDEVECLNVGLGGGRELFPSGADVPHQDLTTLQLLTITLLVRSAPHIHCGKTIIAICTWQAGLPQEIKTTYINTSGRKSPEFFFF